MKEYVLGFMFDKKGEYVCLIKKNKPVWQAGRLNGVGGKVELIETFGTAMCREFKEETGVDNTDWLWVGELKGDEWKVAVFACASDDVFKVSSTTVEEVLTVQTNVAQTLTNTQAIGNIPWLVSFCYAWLFNDNAPSYFKVTYT